MIRAENKGFDLIRTLHVWSFDLRPITHTGCRIIGHVVRVVIGWIAKNLAPASCIISSITRKVRHSRPRSKVISRRFTGQQLRWAPTIKSRVFLFPSSWRLCTAARFKSQVRVNLSFYYKYTEGIRVFSTNRWFGCSPYNFNFGLWNQCRHDLRTPQICALSITRNLEFLATVKTLWCS